MSSGPTSISGSRLSRRNPAAAKITASTFLRTRSIRVSTFPRIGTTSSRRSRPAAQSIICIAPRSSGTDPGAVGQIIESSPDQHIAGVLAHWNRDDLQILCRRGRQVLEVHRDIDLTSAQGIAYRADEDPGAADLGELTLVKITGRGNADKGGADATANAVATWLAWARASADVRAPSRIGGSRVLGHQVRRSIRADLW